ncbi:TPA: formate hydrogenlyase subunit 3 [Klebsiella quasipneumoniae]|nr:formate hydrogenlyase subunit 3 [Klebsiella quasipneumoniae]
MKWYPWLRPSFEQLVGSYQAGRGHHALLLQSLSGMGGEALIYALCRFLMCRQPEGHKSCGHCHSCQLMQAGTHPDYYPLSPEKGKSALGIDAVRDVNDKLYERARLGGAKVVWISDAALLTDAAANALLKTLEEPPKNTWFFLACEEPARLLTTLRSRCRLHHLSPPTESYALAWLEREVNLPQEALLTALRLCASAPAAALFSTVVMKVGLYGMLTVSLAGGVPPLWWGVMLLVLGMITAFIGGLYALMEHNIQRLLAYHTLENIGIILLGLGAFVTGVATRNSTLMVLGFIGGMYHLINHSLFKTTLFLGAGAVWFRTGHRDIEKLGGIGKKMPLISLAMLVGLMAMAALPPLNGFAGEWVIYQSFFKMSTSDLFIGRLLGPLLAVGLAITGALAVMCMAKVYGVTFLGAPRSKEAENATCAPWLMTLSVVMAAVFCLVGGIAAPWLLPLVSGAFPLQAQVSSVVSQPMIALLLIACPLLPFLLMIFFKGDRLAARSRGAAWVCGYDHEQSMVVTAHGFAMPVKEAFAPLLKLRHWLNPVRLVPGWRSASAPALLRGMALVELAVLVVIVISRGA